MAFNKKNLINFFYIFLTFHLIVWTVIPASTNNNLPLDTIEALAWGSNLDWGFNKHPPMSAFLAFPFLLFSNWLKIFLKIKFFVYYQFYY